MKALFSMALVMFSTLSLAMAEDFVDGQEFGENERPAGIPKTVVIRMNRESGVYEMAEVDQIVVNAEDIGMDNLKFTALDSYQPVDDSEFAELNAEVASESWYFHFGFHAGVPYPWFNVYRPYVGNFIYNRYLNWVRGSYNYLVYRPYMFARRFIPWGPRYRRPFYRRGWW